MEAPRGAGGGSGSGGDPITMGRARSCGSAAQTFHSELFSTLRSSPVCTSYSCTTPRSFTVRAPNQMSRPSQETDGAKARSVSFSSGGWNRSGWAGSNSGGR